MTALRERISGITEGSGRYRTEKKGKTSSIPVLQVSLSIACLNEGSNIPKALTRFASEVLPNGTNFLLIISDNGSRGASPLLISESNHSEKKQEIIDDITKTEPAFVPAFMDLLSLDRQRRQSELYTVDQSGYDTRDRRRELDQQRNCRLDEFRKISSSLLREDIFAYARDEEMQREMLVDAYNNPDEFIAMTDTAKSGQKPIEGKHVETIREYSAILLGKYETAENRMRIQIVSGSVKGNFGSVRKFGIEAAKRDFNRNNPEGDQKSHIVVAGFDMDSGIGENFISRIITGFEDHPDKHILVGAVKGMRRDGTPMPFSPAEIGRFVTSSYAAALFKMEGRNIRDFIHPGHGLGGLFKLPDFYPGPLMVMRGNVLEYVPMSDAWASPEDVPFSLSVQREFTKTDGFVDNGVVIYFNPRNLPPFTRFMKDGFKVLFLDVMRRKKANMTNDEFQEYIENMHGYMNDLAATGEIIRTAEESILNVKQNEYVVAHAHRRKHFKNLVQPNDEIRFGWNDITQREDSALIRKVPEEVHLEEGEYVAREVKGKELPLLEEMFEKIVKLKNGQHLLIRRHINNTPIEEIHIAG